MDSSYTKLIISLLVIGSALYAFSPHSTLFTTTDSVQADALQTHSIEIKSGSLSDPRQSELRLRVGSKESLLVTTDQDGRVDLKGGDRSTFNPVFSGTINSLSIPTDKAGSYRIEFHPNAQPDSETEGIVIGTIVVEK